MFGVAVISDTAHASLVTDCGIACPVGTVSGSGVFPAPNTAGPFSITLTGSAASLAHILGWDPSLVPLTIQASGNWLAPCSTMPNPIVQAIRTVIGVAAIVLGPVVRAIDYGSGCGVAIINGTSIGMTIAGSPNTGLVLIANNGQEIAGIVLLGNPAAYNGVIVNVNPTALP